MTTRLPPAARRHLSIALLVPALGCSAMGFDPAREKEGDLERAEAAWAGQQIEDYRYTYGFSCGMCLPIGPAVIDVHDGVVTAARNIGESDPLPVTVMGSVLTVPELFALIRRAVEHQADALEVTYHATLGYPITVAIDWQFGLADDEVWHSVAELRRISALPAPQPAIRRR